MTTNLQSEDDRITPAEHPFTSELVETVADELAVNAEELHTALALVEHELADERLAENYLNHLEEYPSEMRVDRNSGRIAMITAGHSMDAALDERCIEDRFGAGMIDAIRRTHDHTASVIGLDPVSEGIERVVAMTPRP